jgi:hypothetical protein
LQRADFRGLDEVVIEPGRASVAAVLFLPPAGQRDDGDKNQEAKTGPRVTMRDL